MEPTGYLEQYKQDIRQSYHQADLEKEVQIILEQGEEMLVYCLLREEADNPYKKKFSLRAVFMIAALATMVLASIAYLIFRNNVWLGYFALFALAVSTIASFACRAVLKKYVRSFIFPGSEQNTAH